MLSRPEGDPQDLTSEEPVFIAFDGLPVPFFIESATAKGKRWIVKLEGIDSLTEAEELVGREAWFENEEEEDEDSLIGLQVRDSRSRRLVGEIVDCNDYGGSLVITVDTGEGEVLLPLHEELIVSIHEETITLDIPEGLV